MIFPSCIIFNFIYVVHQQQVLWQLLCQTGCQFFLLPQGAAEHTAKTQSLRPGVLVRIVPVQVCIWDAQTGSAIRRLPKSREWLEEHAGVPVQLAWAPDMRHIALWNRDGDVLLLGSGSSRAFWELNRAELVEGHDADDSYSDCDSLDSYDSCRGGGWYDDSDSADWGLSSHGNGVALRQRKGLQLPMLAFSPDSRCGWALLAVPPEGM